MANDPQLIEKLDALVLEIKGFDDPRRASSQWKAALNLLRKTSLNQNHVANVVARRDLGELEKMRSELGSGVEKDPEAPLPEGVTETMLKSAMKAFKRRLKLTLLDEESGINSRNPLSSGVQSQTKAIQPPREWDKPVWDTLVKRGRLRSAGGGFYEMVRED